MRHLDDSRIVDAIEDADASTDTRARGADARAAAAHLASCRTCASRVADLRATLAAVATDHDPGDEPSPLFWDHFPSRVRAAIDREAREAARPWWLRTRGAWLALSTAVLVVVVLLRALWPAPAGDLPQRPAPHTLARSTPVEQPDPGPDVDDLEADDAWAVVRSAADDLDYDAADEAGMMPRPGTLERAATELTIRERAELTRLIEAELKRTGP